MKLLLLAITSMMLMACQNENNPAAIKKTDNTALKACSKDLKVCPDGQSVGRDINNQCQFFDCPASLPATECTDDVKQCPDGSFVPRDKNKACQFKPCPEAKTEADRALNATNKACTKDLKMCPDGHGVGRNPQNNCEFYSCEKSADDMKGEPVMCPQDAKQCPDGSFVGRDSYNNCAFKPCPKIPES